MLTYKELIEAYIKEDAKRPPCQAREHNRRLLEAFSSFLEARGMSPQRVVALSPEDAINQVSLFEKEHQPGHGLADTLLLTGYLYYIRHYRGLDYCREARGVYRVMVG